MAKHHDAGDEVGVIFLTDGVGARGADGGNVEEAKLRAAASAAALEIVGARMLTALDFPDNAIDRVSRLEVVQALEPHIDSFAPSVVYTHHGGDLNIDHRRALEATLTACRPQPGCPVDAIYSFETASSTGWQGQSLHMPFLPQHYVDIGAQLERKLRALTAYRAEMREFPHARSMESI